jgi:capsular exopolysaccharide synthesis family protein
MGSMTKVMQRIQEVGSEPEPVRPDDAAATSPGAAVLDDAATGTRSGFVPGEPQPAPGTPGRDPRAAGQPDPETATPARGAVVWDAQRVDPVVVAFHDPYSAICEQYRSVRARLLTMNVARVPQVLAITSAIPEEGKSVSTLNLGLVMAEGGEHRILLVDADFRRTSLARMLGIPAEPGLAEVLRGEVSLEAALQPSPMPNLHVLPAGKVLNGAYGELLGGAGVGAVIGGLRGAFEYTFVDTPPVTTVSDVCLLAPHCDGAVVVIQMCRTPEPTVQQAIRTLQANNVKILGTILSRFRERGSGYYEHYYSSYYYR